MSAIEKFAERARSVARTIVLPEGQDPRVVTAANKAVESGVVKSIIVLGTEAELTASCAEAGISERKFECLDYLASPLLEEFSQELYEKRKAKGLEIEKARRMMTSRIYFGAMMCRRGLADGLVAGSIASTADMLRAAFHCIGTAPGIKSASSTFVMDLATPAPAGDEVLLFADCGVNPNPDADQLVDIAMATANSYRSLLGKLRGWRFSPSRRRAVLKMRCWIKSSRLPASLPNGWRMRNSTLSATASCRLTPPLCPKSRRPKLPAVRWPERPTC